MSVGPPTFQAHVATTRVFRFRTLAAATEAFTGADLAGLLAMVYVTGASPLGSALFSSTRLKRISMWASSPVSSPTPATVSIQWANGTAGIQREISDTSISPYDIAHVAATPPRQHPAAFWNTAVANTVLFYLTFPSNAIIDVEVDGVLQDGASGNGSLTGVAFTGTTGVVYAMPLDSSSNAPGSRIIVPVGLEMWGN
jgi:hypothetical protein